MCTYSMILWNVNSDASKRRRGMACPHCGSSNTEIRRERIGTSFKSTGKGRNYSSQSNTSYRTVGFCKKCGYTFLPI